MKLLNKISTLMLATVLAISMISFTSCDDDVNDQMNDLKTSLEKEVNDLQSQVNKLESDLAAINSCTCTPHPNVDSIVAVRLTEFYTNVIAIKIDSIKTDITNIKTDITNLRNDVNQNSADIASLAGRVGTLETSVTTNTAAILMLTNQMTTLIADTAIVHNHIRTLQTDVTDLQNRMTLVEIAVQNAQNTADQALLDAGQALADAAAALMLAKADSVEIELLKLHMQQHCDSLTLLAAQIATIDSLAQAYLDSALQYTLLRFKPKLTTIRHPFSPFNRTWPMKSRLAKTTSICSTIKSLHSLLALTL